MPRHGSVGHSGSPPCTGTLWAGCSPPGSWRLRERNQRGEGTPAHNMPARSPQPAPRSARRSEDTPLTASRRSSHGGQRAGTRPAARRGTVQPRRNEAGAHPLPSNRRLPPVGERNVNFPLNSPEAAPITSLSVAACIHARPPIRADIDRSARKGATRPTTSRCSRSFLTTPHPTRWRPRRPAGQSDPPVMQVLTVPSVPAVFTGEVGGCEESLS